MKFFVSNSSIGIDVSVISIGHGIKRYSLEKTYLYTYTDIITVSQYKAVFWADNIESAVNEYNLLVSNKKRQEKDGWKYQIVNQKHRKDEIGDEIISLDWVKSQMSLIELGQ